MRPEKVASAMSATLTPILASHRNTLANHEKAIQDLRNALAGAETRAVRQAATIGDLQARVAQLEALLVATQEPA
jgi:hypothetical protein